jgi:hypothetical protein
MRVIRQTTTQLVLEQRLIGLWAFGALLAFVGLFLTVGYRAPLYLIGGVCIAAGSLLEYLTPVEICDLNKQNQCLKLIQRRWLQRQVREYDLKSINQVRVIRKNYLGAKFYSVRLSLITGQRLNLTLFPTTDRDAQTNTAQRIETFLSGNSLAVNLH